MFNMVFNILFMILVEDAKICPEPGMVELQPLYEIVELSSFSTWDGMYQKSLLASILHFRVVYLSHPWCVKAFTCIRKCKGGKNDLAVLVLN